MKDSRASISFNIGIAISYFISDSSIESTNSFASLIDIFVKSTIDLPSVLSFLLFKYTRRASGRRRFPPQTGHTVSENKDSVPRPWQLGHAPYGELNEKRRGSTSGNDAPSSGQINLDESVSSVPSACLIFTKPPASFSASSNASESRSRPPEEGLPPAGASSETKIESTTASISCRL